MTFKVIFMGTPEFSVPTLAALRDAGHEIVAAYSQPPRPAGRRGLNFVKSPVHLFAEASDIAVSTPVDWKSQTDRDAFVALQADVAVVVAYGLILPKALLTGTRHGCLNLHASLLPRWRGAAPIQRAIMAGDRETGVAVMKMEAGLDTGPVAMTAHIPITPDMTAGELHDRLSVEGARLMVIALERMETGDLAFKPQSGEGATYAGKIEKSETRIDWSLSAKQIHDQIRGLSPVPGAWTPMTIAGTPQRVKILSSEPAEGDGKPGEVLSGDLRIACGSGAIRILSAQKAGSRPSCADAFQNGAQIAVGDRIGA